MMFKKGSFEIGGDIYPVAIKARLLIIFNYFAFPSVALKLKFTPSHSEISWQNKGWARLISMFLRESLGVPSGWGKEESLEPWNPNIIVRSLKSLKRSTRTQLVLSLVSRYKGTEQNAKQ